MLDYFEFKEDYQPYSDLAIFPSLSIECWHLNALGKIGSRLGTPIVMNSLTMKMERVSYARILVEVNASKKLVDQVEFILSNGVARKQPVVYEFTHKLYSTCNRFGHLKDSCQSPAIVAANAPASAVKTVAPKKVPPTEWTMMQRHPKNNPMHQQPAKVEQQPNIPAADNDEQGRSGPSEPKLSIIVAVQNMPP
ncbi:UNVERIFIED_CONTAM: hypothetical protein Sangu_1707700 [Sesamum angustifolium]|uniref:DUF4283 domain-containing protein n=1 Tax=Sesamum angustifolium TaxID=2727405 RepID=A0AAW2MJE2_9LAMI